MKRRANKLMALLLSGSMVLTAIPSTVFAAPGGDTLSESALELEEDITISDSEEEIVSEETVSEPVAYGDDESGNPDGENPDSENPDGENPDGDNPDEENPDEEPEPGTFEYFFKDLKDYAEIANDDTYPFAVTEDETALMSTNKAVNSARAYITLTAKTAFSLGWRYKISSELRYDYLSVYQNSTDLNMSKKADYSGTISDYKLYTLDVAEGDVIKIGYAKDSSGNSGDDTLWLKDFMVLSQISLTGVPSTATITVADNDGNTYAVNNGMVALPDGTYTYHAEAFGYQDADGTFTVAGSSFELNLDMQKNAGYQVTFALTGQAEGKTPVIQVTYNGTAQEANEDGTYTLTPAEYSYTISGTGYKTISGSFTVEDQDITIDAALEEVPTMEEYLGDVLNYASLENDATYPYAILESGQGLVNTNKGKSSSTSQFKLTFTRPAILTFDYTVSSESNYDKIKITQNSTELKVDSGVNSGSITVNAVAGDVLTIAYTKDSSGDRNDDEAIVKNFSVTALRTITFENAPAGASISLKDADDAAVTITDGAAAVSEGTYSYEISAFGYETKTGTVTVAEEDVTVDAALTAQTGKKLTFSITGLAEDVEPQIIVTREDIAYEASEDGSYNLIPSEYSYKIKAEGYKTVRGTVQIEDEDVTLEIAMTEGTQWDGDVAEGFAGGTGTAEDPYQIATTEQLAYLSAQVAAGQTFAGEYLILTADLDMGGETAFTPIGTTSTLVFKGSFDGNGCAINNLYVNTTANYAGLFGYVDGAAISNVTVDGSISGKQYVAGIAGYANAASSFTNCTNLATVTATSTNVGGIVGRSNGNSSGSAVLSGCINKGSISNDTNNYAGGLVGYAQYTKIENSYNTGSVYSNRGGGIVGQEGINSTFKNLYSIGSVTMAAPSSYNYAGALCGYVYSSDTWTNCYYLSDAQGGGNLTPAGMIAKTSDQLKSSAVIAQMGGSFVADTNNINNGYPVLGRQDPSALYLVYFNAEGCTVTVKDADDQIVAPGENAYEYNLPSGTYSYTVEKEEYITVEGTFTINGSGTTITPEMVICTYPFAMSVLPAEATVTATTADGEQITLQSGTTNLPKGSYSYTASLFGYDTEEGTFEVTGENDSLGIALTFSARRTVTVVAKDKDTSLVLSDAAVTITHTEGGVQTASEDGSYALPDGTYSYTVTCPEYINEKGTIVVNGENLTTEIQMEQGSNVWTGEIAEEAPATETIDGEDYYLITSAEELAWAADQVNTQGNKDINLKINTNLVLNSDEAPTANRWTGIGNYSNQYTGTIDGNGKTIAGYYSTDTGLVGYAGAGSLVKNLTISGSISAAAVTGAFANQSYGSFDHCSNRVDITANYSAAVVVGGIVGRSYASCQITNCVNQGTINVTNSGSYSDVKVGGIAGDSYASLDQCANFGNISSSAPGYAYLGGILGSGNGSSSNTGAQITNCYNRGSVAATGTKESYAGGIAGRQTMGSTPVLANCYNTGSISATSTTQKVGAIAGDYLCNIENCYYLAGSAAAAAGNEREGYTVDATAKTEAELCERDLVIALGNTVWGAVEGSYPAFLWQGAEAVDDSQAAQAVAEAKAALTLEETLITENKTMDLPASVEGFEGTITWSSDNTDVITDAGQVTLPEEGIVYVTLTATIALDGVSETKAFTITVKSEQTQTRELLDKAAAVIANGGALTPTCGMDTNINTYLEGILADKGEQLGETGWDEISVSVENIGTITYPTGIEGLDCGISETGTITYFYTDPTALTYAYRNAVISDAAFTLTLNGQTAEATKSITLGWDASRLQAYMENALQAALEVFEPYTEDGEIRIPVDTSSLEMPKTLDDYRFIQISWGSESELIEMAEEEPLKTTTTMNFVQPEEDTEIVLEANVDFTLDDDICYFEEEAATIVKLGGDLDTLREQMQAALDENYTVEKLKYSITKEVIDPDHVKGDIQLLTPRNTGIENYSDYRFAASSSNEDVIKINGYRANVYQPMPDEDAEEVVITITMTHKTKDVSVTKEFTLTVDPLTTEELDDAVALMEQVSAAYWDGINDNANEDAQHVTASLHAFQEADLDEDGNLYFIYNVNDRTNKGIVTGDMADYSEVGGQEAWNKFRSSKPDVIAHENLVLTQPQYNTAVTVDSVLEHAIYGKYAKLVTEGTWYDNYFSKLAGIPVSAEMKVLGTDGEDPEAEHDVNVTVRVTGVDMTGAVDKEVTVKNTNTIAEAISAALEENYTLTVSSAGYVQSLTGPEDFNEANADVDYWGQYFLEDGVYDCISPLTNKVKDGGVYAIISNETTTDSDSYWGYKYDVWFADTAYEAVAGETITPVVYQMVGSSASPWSGIKVYCDDQQIAVTDDAGKAAISFAEAGTYLITTGDSNHIFSYAYVTVEPAPSTELVITEQPVDAAGKIGESISYSVTAENAASYQWQYSKNGRKWYKSIADGSDTACVSLKISETNRDNMYRCKVTGVDGTVLYTDIAGLEIVTAPVIIQQPVDWNIQDGNAASFTVTAENIDSYQWYYSKDGGTKWYKSSLAGSDSDTISLTASKSNRETVYRCKLTGVDGSVIYSDKAGFTGYLKITEQPQNVPYSAGTITSFTVAAENADTYQWYYSKNGGTTWYKSSAKGATTATLTLKMSASNQNNIYRCKLTSAEGEAVYTEVAGFTSVF